MGYYVRVLSTSSDCVPVSVLSTAIEQKQLKAQLSVDDGTPEDWTQLTLSHTDGVEIAMIERNVVEDGSLGAEELAEFADELDDAKPAAAAQWLREFFERVRCITAFQLSSGLLSGNDPSSGWDIFDAVKTCVWSAAPAIVQADREGFSNERGYHILWQFSDSVTGDWSMGVLRDGQWIHFTMDLGDRKQRAAFLAGEVPKGVKLH